MAEVKWNVGTVQVNGQAMFGDNNRMEVHGWVQDSKSLQQIETLFSQLRDALAVAPDRGPGSVCLADKARVNACLLEMTQELKKKQGERDSGVFNRCLQMATDVLKVVPGALKSILTVKSLLGM